MLIIICDEVNSSPVNAKPACATRDSVRAVCLCATRLSGLTMSLARTVFGGAVPGLMSRRWSWSYRGEIGVKSVRYHLPTAVRLLLPNRHILTVVGDRLAVGTLKSQLVGIHRIREVTTPGCRSASTSPPGSRFCR
jgi:hypothetical protein